VAYVAHPGVDSHHRRDTRGLFREIIPGCLAPQRPTPRQHAQIICALLAFPKRQLRKFCSGLSGVQFKSSGLSRLPLSAEVTYDAHSRCESYRTCSRAPGAVRAGRFPRDGRARGSRDRPRRCRRVFQDRRARPYKLTADSGFFTRVLCGVAGWPADRSRRARPAR
jgi:hypothetical protein